MSKRAGVERSGQFAREWTAVNAHRREIHPEARLEETALRCSKRLATAPHRANVRFKRRRHSRRRGRFRSALKFLPLLFRLALSSWPPDRATRVRRLQIRVPQRNVFQLIFNDTHHQRPVAATATSGFLPIIQGDRRGAADRALTLIRVLRSAGIPGQTGHRSRTQHAAPAALGFPRVSTCRTTRFGGASIVTVEYKPSLDSRRL